MEQRKREFLWNLILCWLGMQQNQVAFKSYPVEPIGPLACTSDGAYLAGGGVSGRIYFWEVSLGNPEMKNA